MSELGFMLGARTRRLNIRAFPVLQQQVRCSSGFTHAPGGALQSLATRLTPVTSETAVAPEDLQEPQHKLARERRARRRSAGR